MTLPGATTAVPVSLPFAPIEHLGQVYAGFEELERQGVVRLDWTEPTAEDLLDLPHMILRVDVGGVVVRYDVNDGTNAYGDRETTLATFREREFTGHLFRRSHHPDVTQACGPQVAVHPLGVNYFVRPQHETDLSGLPLPVRVKETVRRIPGAHKVLRFDTKRQRAADFEVGPTLRGPHRALLVTRLWDPDDPQAVEGGYQADRRRINADRIELVRRARERFGEAVTAGLTTDAYSARVAPPELLVPPGRTVKAVYLRQVREHAVCIASRGLHESTGWRFGEYVAASRAIVTERLAYDPGPALRADRNFVEFSTVDEALDHVGRLLDDPAAVTAMMVANRAAYNLAIRPDALVLRSLLIALGHPDPAV